MILNKSQAEAVYGAMCALNNVDAFRENEFHARELADGRIVVHKLPPTFSAAFAGPEIHANQSEFAAAYGLV